MVTDTERKGIVQRIILREFPTLGYAEAKELAAEIVKALKDDA